MNKVVYTHTRNDTGKVFYVGEGSMSRAYSIVGRNAHWTAIFNKCGRTVQILMDGLDKETSLDTEEFFKALYGFENLSNQLPGREHDCTGFKHSQDTLDEMSRTRQGKTKSLQMRQRLSQSTKGKTMSDDAKKNMSDAQAGKVRTQEHKDNISKNCKGKKRKPRTDEHRKNLSKALLKCWKSKK